MQNTGKTAPNRKQGRRKKCKPEDESGTWKHAATKGNRRHRQRAFDQGRGEENDYFIRNKNKVIIVSQRIIHSARINENF